MAAPVSILCITDLNCSLMRYQVRTLMISIAAMALVTLAPADQVKDPSDAIYGEWEIVEITFNGRVQVLPEPPVGWFIIEKGGFIWILYGDVKKTRDDIHSHKGIRRGWTEPCVIRPGEIEVWEKYKKEPKVRFTALYEIKDGKLRFVWNEVTGERPKSFDAMNDRQLALYVAKKVK